MNNCALKQLKSDTRFCHYTSIESAREILSTGSFYLNKFSGMNDLSEGKYHKDIDGHVFSTCFCHSDSKNIPLFYLYGGIDGKGCRIEFTKSRLNSLLSEVEVFPVNKRFKCLKKPFDCSRYEIKYDFIDYVGSDGTLFNKSTNEILERFEDYDRVYDEKKKEDRQYFLKNAIWKYEKEFRVAIVFKEPIEYDRVALKFNIRDKESGISVSCGPEMNDTEFNDVKSEFSEYGIVKVNKLDSMQVRMNLLERNRKLFERFNRLKGGKL